MKGMSTNGKDAISTSTKWTRLVGMCLTFWDKLVVSILNTLTNPVF